MAKIKGGIAPEKGTAFYKKIQRQRNLGNTDKMKDLTWRYRARVSLRDPSAAQNDSSLFGAQVLEAKLKRYSQSSNPRARKQALKLSRRLRSAATPGEPGGTY